VESNNIKPDTKLELDIRNANIIFHPKLDLTSESTSYEDVKLDWNTYWIFYNKGISHYKRGWYKKPKTELKVSFVTNKYDIC
jgi:hypothetical protein